MTIRREHPASAEAKPTAEAAMRRATLRARETARRYGTPIYVLYKGRVVAKKP